MTTPLPSPTPFAELLKRATPGKPTASVTEDGIDFIVSKNAVAICYFGVTKSQNAAWHTETKANTELICRLLSWAHAGGVEELHQSVRIVEGLVRRGHLGYAPLTQNIRASLALLDGKK